jgi:hypothetical protein
VDKPHVSTVLSLYFYYKTGCQVLFVKKCDEYSGVRVSRIGIPGSRDGGGPTATSRKILSGSRGPLLKKREKWRTPGYLVSTFGNSSVVLAALSGPTRHATFLFWILVS